MKKLLAAFALSNCLLLSAADNINTLQQQKNAAEALIKAGNNDIAIGESRTHVEDTYLGEALAVDNSEMRAAGQQRIEAGRAEVTKGTNDLVAINAKIKTYEDDLRARLAKASFRLWHDKTGRIIRAELEEIQGNNIRILRDDGTEFTLSNRSVSDKGTPVQVVSNGVTAFSAVAFHSLFLKRDGSLWGTDFGGGGPYGDGSEIPVEIVANGVIAISATFTNILVLKNDGSVWRTCSGDQPANFALKQFRELEALFKPYPEAPGFLH